MKQSVAIIGANYGDEGKGLMTNYMCAIMDPDVVIRFNGGAQAGHTVVSNRYGKHVFQHIGCGTFQHVPTHLSKFFVVNPILFMKEYKELLNRDDMAVARVSVDGKCYVTTPYDMIMNQILENSRGDGRHGSCGVGFGETIERTERSDHRLYAADLLSGGNIERFMKSTLRTWVPERLTKLGLHTKENLARFSEDLIPLFRRDCEHFVEVVEICSHLKYKGKTIVFEGAQGLLLDQNNRDMFPNVTRSNTGMRNIVHLAFDLNIRGMEAVYVTRSYLTRHGAGPFENECDPESEGMEDYTNVKHDFQGNLRYARFTRETIKQMHDRIINDASSYAGSIGLRDFGVSIAVTHMDQVKELDLLRLPECHYVSYGPKRSDIRATHIKQRE